MPLNYSREGVAEQARTWDFGAGLQGCHRAPGDLPCPFSGRLDGRRATPGGKSVFGENRRFGKESRWFLARFHETEARTRCLRPGTVPGPLWMPPALCGPSVAVLTADPPCHARRDARSA